MKILVVGGTGLIGKEVSKKLGEIGHEVVVGSPSMGVNIISGEGLAEALNGAEVVIDLSNSASPDDETALSFFRAAGKNLVSFEKDAKIKHHIVLSIVGTDRAQHIGYLRAKTEQEENIINSGIPYTIIRSTQFHEHISTIIAVQGDEREVNVSTVDYQPIAAQDVVNFIVELATQQPRNSIVEIAGPTKAPMTEFVQKYLKAKGDNKVVVSDNENRYMHLLIPKDLLVPLADFQPGTIDFEGWMLDN